MKQKARRRYNFKITDCRVIKECVFDSIISKVILIESKTSTDHYRFTVDLSDLTHTGDFQIRNSYITVSNDKTFPKTIRMKPKYKKFLEKYIEENLKEKYEDLLSETVGQ